MNECPNCGMLPFACVCIPWCYKHDRQDYDPRCQECEREREAVERRKQAKRAQRQAVWQHRWEEFCNLFR
jgi:hypothetical protein